MNRYLLIVIGFSAMILAGCQSRPSSSAPPEAVIDKTTADAALSLGTALNHYAADHDGKYLEGKSSTEIFQKLIDGNYITDPAVLYVDLPGKVKAATKTLQPENVCWDVTSNVDRNSSDMLPVVFLTGYQINYSAGAKSMALPEPSRSWSDWWSGRMPAPRTAIAVAYKGNFKALLKVDSDGSVSNFIPANFDPRHRVYHQLTPDGLLSP